MTYQEYECHPKLSAFVLCYWKFQVPEKEGSPPSFKHFITPDGCPSLVLYSYPQFEAQGSSLVGPTKYISELEIFRGSTTIGVRFRPALIQSIVGMSGIDLRDQTVQPAPTIDKLDLQSLFGLLSEDDAWTQELDRLLLQSQLHPTPDDPSAYQAAEIIMQHKGNLSISDLTRQLPKSERQLQKNFKRSVGLTMKEFAITMRIRASVIDLEYHKEEYQDIVHRQGYFDQAHFIRDFSKLSRISLPDFKRYIRNIEHVGLGRWG